MDEIRHIWEGEFDDVYNIINDSASAYKGIIPADRWHEPYMTREHLKSEIDDGVEFCGYYENGKLAGVMGIQDKKAVLLIRHAYVSTHRRNAGIGGKLLENLRKDSSKPILIGTWADAFWAVKFYEKNGFRRVSDVVRKNALLR